MYFTGAEKFSAPIGALNSEEVYLQSGFYTSHRHPIAYYAQLRTEIRQKKIRYVHVFPVCDPSGKMGSVTESVEKKALCIFNENSFAE